MKIFNIIFTILFVVFAALQYNDPDPYIWIPIYLVSAWVCFQTYKGNLDTFSHGIIIASSAVYALKLFFDRNGVISWFKDHDAENLVQTMKATKPWIEETREFGGLMLTIFVATINLISLKKTKVN